MHPIPVEGTQKEKKDREKTLMSWGRWWCWWRWWGQNNEHSRESEVDKQLSGTSVGTTLFTLDLMLHVFCFSSPERVHVRSSDAGGILYKSSFGRHHRPVYIFIAACLLWRWFFVSKKRSKCFVFHWKCSCLSLDILEKKVSDWFVLKSFLSINLTSKTTFPSRGSVFPLRQFVRHKMATFIVAKITFIMIPWVFKWTWK